MHSLFKMRLKTRSAKPYEPVFEQHVDKRWKEHAFVSLGVLKRLQTSRESTKERMKNSVILRNI